VGFANALHSGAFIVDPHHITGLQFAGGLKDLRDGAAATTFDTSGPNTAVNGHAAGRICLPDNDLGTASAIEM
jgi:hypothetical protein